MRQNIYLLFLVSLLISCGQDRSKQRELELKEKELELRERELSLKEKDTFNNNSISTPTDNNFKLGTISKLPKYFDEIAALHIWEQNGKEEDLFVCYDDENKGMGVINLNGELVELKFIKAATKGQTTNGSYSNDKYTVTYSLNNNNILNDADPPIIKGILTIEGNGYKKIIKNIVGSWLTP